MAVYKPANRESASFYSSSKNFDNGMVGRIYKTGHSEIAKPKDFTQTYDANLGKTDKDGKPLKEKSPKTIDFKPMVTKQGTPSLFNRYELFYFDNFSNSPSGKGEDYFDSPNRLTEKIQSASKISHHAAVIRNPTSQNLINWSKSVSAGDVGTGAVEYDWPDFLWCKNYGVVPNNYMVTLRRFAIPAADDLFNPGKQPGPDIARMITWVDGEVNKWESVGLKFSTSVTWRKLESETQSINMSGESSEYGNEGNALGGALGSVFKLFAKATDTTKAQAQRSQGNRQAIDPYHDTQKVHGPIDVIKEMMVRDKGINFEQTFNLTFEYELRSIDGINPKIAFMDLLANVMQLTATKATFWGGEIKYWGGQNHRNVSPVGNPELAANGDYKGYINSVFKNVSSKLETLAKGEDIWSVAGISNILQGMGGNLLDGIVGGGLDKMGRPAAVAVNSLLSGADTGHWHVMVGNPANPIISVGNLILEKTDIDFDGQLGPDDFPSKLKVVCTLKPARPRDRNGILDMFHRNGRIYTTTDPKDFGVKIDKKKKPNNKKANSNSGAQTSETQTENPDDPYRVVPDLTFGEDKGLMNERFANWLTVNEGDYIINQVTTGIY